ASSTPISPTPPRTRSTSESATGASSSRPRSCSASRLSLTGKELLELHGRPHVALELELAGHVGARRVLLARDDLLEDLLGGTDRAVGAIVHAVLDRDLALGDLHRPLSRALDVEGVRVVHARRLARVGLGGEA